MRISFNPALNTGYSNYSTRNSTRPDFKVASTISFGESNDTFDFDKEYKKNLDKRSGFKKFFGAGKKAAYQKTVDMLTGFNLDRNTREEQKNQTIEAHKQVIQEMDGRIKAEVEKNAILERQLEEARLNGVNQQKIQMLEEKLKLAYDLINAKELMRDSEAERLRKVEETQANLVKREAGKGWEKIAGNNAIKDQLDNWFISKIAFEKAGSQIEFPNGILFYGPQSTGKTRFAKAFAEQSQCAFREIDIAVPDNDDILEQLEEAKKSAVEHYNKTGNRTILLFDEFDAIAQLSEEEKEIVAKGGKKSFNETFVGQIKSFLQDCSDKFKCTVFMTTNHPLDIDSAIFEDRRCIPCHVYLGPPEADDVEAIFRYYLNGFTKEAIDYDNVLSEMATVIEHDAPEHCFSAGRVSQIAEECTLNCKNVTENALIAKIRELGPDITPEMLKRFGKETIELGKRLC